MAIKFDNFGVKTVTRTDKGKGAYVPNRAQVAAILAAGISPAESRPAPDFEVVVLGDASRRSVMASFYNSERSTEADRTPEPRMGHELISKWLEEGDTLLIGNAGPVLFAQKISRGNLPASTGGASRGRSTDPAIASTQMAMAAEIVRRAKSAKGKPAKRVVERNDYVRNPFVVAAAVMRAGGRCEMPGCNCKLFEKDGGTVYLEVHHIVPLSEGGDDTLANAAALCPHHHRLLHFGKDRGEHRKILARYIGTVAI